MPTPTNVELCPFPTTHELAWSAAAGWLDLLASASRPWHVALSGGRIARDFYRATRELAAMRPVPVEWRQVHFYWADERCVPPEHPESNFALAAELLLNPLGIPSANVHRIRGEAAPAEAAAAAEIEVRRLVASGPSGDPELDLVILGMGEDGHVASLFPDGPVGLADPELYRAVIGPKPPPQRITLTYRALLAAKAVWVLVAGPEKQAALRASLAWEPTPLGRVLGGRRRTRILFQGPELTLGP